MPVIGTPISGSADGYYADQTDLAAKYGEANVAAFSNVANDTTTSDATRIQAALDYADREIDKFLRRNGFESPLATTSDDFASMTEMACMLAYAWLKGIRDWRQSPEAADVEARMLYFQVQAGWSGLRANVLSGIDATLLSDDPAHPTPIG